MFEGFPNTFVQAWLRSVPVVSLQFDPDDVIHNEGLGFHSGDFGQLCNHIERLANDEALRATIGARCRAFAQTNHGLDENINRIAQLVDTSIAESLQTVTS